MLRCIFVVTVLLVPFHAFAQVGPSINDSARLGMTREPAKDATINVAAASNPSLMVSKTAQVHGPDVCGVIRITNTGFGPVTVSGIADSLEVHFSNNVPPPGLTAGSTPNWFKVADVPIALPGPIAPRTTATIPYCFSICQARDYPGANSMRNVVTVIVANPPGLPRSFGARSNSFAPPFLDCQACCLPDGSCSDTVPARCESAGGLPHGANTDCATTECTQACCLGDGSCGNETIDACEADGGEALGLGTDCATTTCRGACCQLNGSPACINDLTSMECDIRQGTFLGPDTTCESEFAACPTGACCRGIGDCIDFQTDFGCGFFGSGTFLGVGTTCGPTSCNVACCFDDGSCRDETITACQSDGGNTLGFGTTCDTDATTCRPGACCQLNGSPACIDDLTIMECDTRQGTFLGPDTTCESEFAACPTGACCRGIGDCIDFQTDFGCGFFGSGTFLGVGTTCESDFAGPTGACCHGNGDCIDMSEGQCVTCEQGTFLGLGTSCATANTTCRGACCNLSATPACFNVPPAECELRQGTFLGLDTTCETEFAACPTGACCSGFGGCVDFRTEGGCEFFDNGTFLGVGTTCTSASCCTSLFGSCTADSDCCSGLICTGGLCDMPIGP